MNARFFDTNVILPAFHARHVNHARRWRKGVRFTNPFAK
jgi:hypothetical protein